jgi:DNA-binding NarL/FixJ family response regulator
VIRVAVCAGIRLYRDGLVHSLSRAEGLDVVAAIGDATAPAIATLRTARPCVVVVDATGADGADVLRRIAEGLPDATVVALAIPEVGEVVVACAEAGVAAYTTRESSLDELVETVRRAVRREVVFAPHIGHALMQRVHALAEARPAEQARARLTRREREIVELIDAGLSNKQIATTLSIELATVKNHVHNILGKLGVERRAEAAASLRANRI